MSQQWPLGGTSRSADGPFAAFGRHRGLLVELIRRDILGRYRGAHFGLLWSLLGPLMMLMIYTIAFGEILGSRWQRPASEAVPFGLVLFLGIMVHGFFAECLARAPRLIVDNGNYVKRIVFPLPILAWVVALSGLFHFAMNLLVFAVLCALIAGKFTPWIVTVPIVIAPLVIGSVAVVWLMSSIGVHVRDLSQAVPVVVTALLFLSSAIIPVDTLPPRYQVIFQLNPLTFFIDQVREVSLWGNAPDWAGLGIRYVLSIILLYACFAWFRSSSKGFADVI